MQHTTLDPPALILSEDDGGPCRQPRPARGTERRDAIAASLGIRRNRSRQQGGRR